MKHKFALQFYTMKKLILSAIFLSGFTVIGQIRTPAPSPTQSLVQDFGLSKIELTYSRPSLKGRDVFKEKSELAPLGEVWRTGANASTKLRFNEPVTFGGNLLDTGNYALFTIPGKNEWTVIVNKNYKNWGTEYVEKDDLFRFKVPAEKFKDFRETFTINFANMKPESCDLVLVWGGTGIRVPITVSVKDKVRASVEKALSAEKITAGTYRQAANFYYNYDKDYKKALEVINKAVETDPKSYSAYLLKSQIELDMGNRSAAKASAEKTVELATAAKSSEYIKLGNELISKAK